MAHQALNIPFVSLHLQPSVIWSEYQSPLLARGLLLGDGVPRWLKRLQHWVGNTMMNRMMLAGANEFRAELNLPPIKNAWDLMHSPQRIICMFPDWYAAPQPDWPANVVMAHFPLWDETGVTEVPPAVREFLDGGERPIAFTPGSAMVQGREFFSAAVDACRRLGRRGMLLTRHAEQIPADLPEGVQHFDYAPFSEVLPRCAALVYHGGIGTLSQALAAGIPHVIMPMAHDQPDNAARIERLGVGATLWPRQFRGGRLAKVLAGLLSSSEVSRRCRELAARFAGVDGLELASDAIEQFGRQMLGGERRMADRMLAE
jgi:UDP:flavonoid glycosyltransferase YjiC (YdhE family)